MIKFETINGTLCRMVEPEPLTPDAEMPCLVRLIQDDSPMGRYNRDAAYFDVIGKLFVAQKIKENPFYSNTLHAYEKNSLNQDYCIASIHTLEIIGYPVEEGSRWWALYQMMQGKKVSYKGVIGNVYLALNQDGNVQQYTMDNFAYIGAIRSKLEFGKNHAVNTGWQIYKEPELKYKVGDWVEVHGCCQARVINIEYSSISGEAKYATLSSNNRIRISYITRKLDPSEVVIRIGCLSGTVEKSQFHKNGFILVTAAGNCWILFDALDKETRDLVEGLLKAQENDK